MWFIFLISKQLEVAQQINKEHIFKKDIKMNKQHLTTNIQ